MGRICFWVGLALVFLVCRHYSFWVIFGWAYAAVSVALIVVCFTYNHRQSKEASPEHASSMLSPCLELESNE